MRSSRIKFLALIMLICIGASALAACSSSCGDENEPEPEIITISLTESALNGKVREAVTLPGVTATSSTGGDLTDKVRLRIYFTVDEVYVLPAVNALDGVPAADVTEFTPDKVGDYTLIYFYKDAAAKLTEKRITLTALPNPDSVLGQNLVGDTTKWSAGGTGQSSSFNGFGEVIIGGKNSANFAGAVYTGAKTQNDDLITFTFKAGPKADTSFYNVGFYLSKSYEQSQPAADEGAWPTYYNMRIGEKIETFVITASNNNMDLFPQINTNLLDGKYHTISMRIKASSSSVSAKLWIDKDASGSPSYSNSVTIEAVKAKYGDDTQHVKIFSEDITGFLTFASYVPNGIYAGDTMLLKALSINGSNNVAVPELVIGGMPETMILGEEAQLASVYAKDANDYTDISAGVELFVKAPSASSYTKYTVGSVFTPDEFGTYAFRYVIKDASGVYEYAEYEVLCAKGENTVPPEINFTASTTGLTSTVNGVFALPLPSTVTDAFGDDISSRLIVTLLGKEGADLTGKTAFTFRSPGTHSISYSVTDYNGNETEVIVEVEVSGAYTGDLTEDSSWWKLNNATASDGNITLNGSDAAVTFGGQKVYDETVSVLMNLSMGISGNDGALAVILNIRGGKNLVTVPQTAHGGSANDFSWPSGLTVMIHRDWGLLVCGKGYSASPEFAKAVLTQSMRDIFHGKDVVLTVQATDIYDVSGNLTGISVKLWLNGEKVDFSGSYIDANKNVLISNRVVQLNDYLLSAGWLSVFQTGDDSLNGTKGVIKALTIDGTAAETLTAVLDKESNQSAELGAPYTLPVMTLTKGTADLSAEVKRYIWINNESQPDITDGSAAYGELTLLVDEAYLSGFKVLYVYEGKLLKTVSVRVTAEIGNLSFDGPTEDLTAALGSAFEYPELLSATIGAQPVTSGITVKAVYKDHNRTESVAGGTFTPLFTGDFVLEYYYGDTLLTEVEVEGQTPAGDIASRIISKPTDGVSYTTDFNLNTYNSEVSMVVSITATPGSGASFRIPLRGKSVISAYQYPRDMFLIIYASGGARLQYNSPDGSSENWLASSSTAWYNAAQTEYLISYKVNDLYIDSMFAGIEFSLYINGVQMTFAKNDIPPMTHATSGNVFIAKSWTDNAPDTYYAASLFYIFANNMTFTLNSLYIDGSDTATVYKFSESVINITARIGEPFTVPSLTVITKRAVITGGYTVKLNGDTVITDADYTFDTTGTHTIGYYSGDTLITSFSVNVAQQSLVAVLDKENNQSVDLDETYTLPVMTLTRGSTDLSGEVKIYIWINNEPQPDITDDDAAYIGLTLLADDNYVAGFKVLYVYEGELVKSVSVSVAAEVSISFDGSTQNLTAVLGSVFDYPKVVSATMGARDITQDITVTLTYTGHNYTETVSNAFIPVFTGDFVLKYYFADTLLETVEVEGQTLAGDIFGRVISKPTGGVSYTTDFDLNTYNNEVSMVVSITAVTNMNDATFRIPLRGSTMTSPYTYARDMFLIIFAKGGARIDYTNENGSQTNWLASSTTAWYNAAQTEYLINYKVNDLYINSEFAGIEFSLYINGVQMTFAKNDIPTMTHATPGNVFIAKSWTDNAPESYYAPSLFYIFANDMTYILNSLYIDGSDGATVYKFTNTANLAAAKGEPFTLPVLTEIKKRTVAAAVYTVMLNETEITEDTYTFMSAGVYGLSYYVNEELIDVLTVDVIDPADTVYFEFEQSSVFTHTAGSDYILPGFTAVNSNEENVKANVKTFISHGFTETEVGGATYKHMSRADFDLVYRIGSLELARQTVTVSGAHADNVNLKGVSGFATTGGGGFVYKTEKIYSTEVTVKFTWNGVGTLDFGLRGNTTDAGSWFNWQSGLVVKIAHDASWGDLLMTCTDGWVDDGWGKVDYGDDININPDKTTDMWVTGGNYTEHTLTYSAVDVFADGVFTGINVSISFDGTAYFTNQFIPASAVVAAPEKFTDSFFFIWNNDGEAVYNVTELYFN